MSDAKFKELFLEVVKRAKKKYTFVLEAFDINDNRVDLTLRPTKGADLSTIMQYILSVFAVRWNKLNGLKGHVWYDRFKSEIIETYEELMLIINLLEDRIRRQIVLNKFTSDKFNSCYHRWRGIKTLVGPYPKTLLPYLS